MSWFRDLVDKAKAIANSKSEDIVKYREKGPIITRPNPEALANLLLFAFHTRRVPVEENKSDLQPTCTLPTYSYARLGNDNTTTPLTLNRSVPAGLATWAYRVAQMKKSLRSTSSSANTPNEVPVPIFHTLSPAWQRDDDAVTCQCCGVEFTTLLTRRHHCRRCGQLVCGNCSRRRAIHLSHPPLPQPTVSSSCVEEAAAILREADAHTEHTDFSPFVSALQTSPLDFGAQGTLANTLLLRAHAYTRPMELKPRDGRFGDNKAGMASPTSPITFNTSASIASSTFSRTAPALGSPSLSQQDSTPPSASSLTTVTEFNPLADTDASLSTPANASTSTGVTANAAALARERVFVSPAETQWRVCLECVSELDAADRGINLSEVEVFLRRRAQRPQERYIAEVRCVEQWLRHRVEVVGKGECGPESVSLVNLADPAHPCTCVQCTALQVTEVADGADDGVTAAWVARVSELPAVVRQRLLWSRLQLIAECSQGSPTSIDKVKKSTRTLVSLPAWSEEDLCLASQRCRETVQNEEWSDHRRDCWRAIKTVVDQRLEDVCAREGVVCGVLLSGDLAKLAEPLMTHVHALAGITLPQSQAALTEKSHNSGNSAIPEQIAPCFPLQRLLAITPRTATHPPLLILTGFARPTDYLGVTAPSLGNHPHTHTPDLLIDRSFRFRVLLARPLDEVLACARTHIDTSTILTTLASAAATVRVEQSSGGGVSAPSSALERSDVNALPWDSSLLSPLRMYPLELAVYHRHLLARSDWDSAQLLGMLASAAVKQAHNEPPSRVRERVSELVGALEPPRTGNSRQESTLSGRENSDNTRPVISGVTAAWELSLLARGNTAVTPAVRVGERVTTTAEHACSVSTGTAMEAKVGYVAMGVSYAQDHFGSGIAASAMTTRRVDGSVVMRGATIHDGDIAAVRAEAQLQRADGQRHQCFCVALGGTIHADIPIGGPVCENGCSSFFLNSVAKEDVVMRAPVLVDVPVEEHGPVPVIFHDSDTYAQMVTRTAAENAARDITAPSSSPSSPSRTPSLTAPRPLALALAPSMPGAAQPLAWPIEGYTDAAQPPNAAIMHAATLASQPLPAETLSLVPVGRLARAMGIGRDLPPHCALSVWDWLCRVAPRAPVTVHVQVPEKWALRFSTTDSGIPSQNSDPTLPIPEVPSDMPLVENVCAPLWGVVSSTWCAAAAMGFDLSGIAAVDTPDTALVHVHARMPVHDTNTPDMTAGASSVDIGTVRLFSPPAAMDALSLPRVEALLSSSTTALVRVQTLARSLSVLHAVAECTVAPQCALKDVLAARAGALPTETEDEAVLASASDASAMGQRLALHTLWAHALAWTDALPSPSHTPTPSPEEAQRGRDSPMLSAMSVLQSLQLPALPRDARWRVLGFQADQPHTDFRSMGLLSLHVLCYVATRRPALMRSLVALQGAGKEMYHVGVHVDPQGSAVKHTPPARALEAREYPLATVAVNITALVASLLPNSDALGGEYVTVNVPAASTTSSAMPPSPSVSPSASPAATVTAARAASARDDDLPTELLFEHTVEPHLYAEAIRSGSAWTLPWLTLSDNLNPELPPMPIPAPFISGLTPTCRLAMAALADDTMPAAPAVALARMRQHLDAAQLPLDVLVQYPLCRVLARPHRLQPHVQFFELCAALLALVDMLFMRARAGYLQFPHVIAAVKTRLHAALARSPVSFDHLLEMLWEDERPFLLHRAQVRLPPLFTAPRSSATRVPRSPCSECGNTCTFSCPAATGYFFDVYAQHARLSVAPIVAAQDNDLTTPVTTHAGASSVMLE